MSSDRVGFPAVRFDEELIHSANGASTGFHVTSDGLHALWMEVDGVRTRIVYDGVPGTPVDGVELDQQGDPILYWSKDRRRVAWSAQRGGRFLVGVDGVEHDSFDALSNEIKPTFSPDGGHVAYGAYVDGAAHLVVDGEVVSEPGLAPVPPAFSADGARLAYAMQDGLGTAARQRMIVDGVPGPWHGQILLDPDGWVRPTFSPDGRRFAYQAADGQQIRVVVDGAPGPAHLGAFFPTFSPDGQRLVHAGEFEGGWSLIEDGREGPRFGLVVEPTFSPDSRRLAYGAFFGEKRAVVVDGEVGPEFTDIWAPVAFSSDGRRVAYLGKRRSKGFLGKGTRWQPVVDGRLGVEVDEINSSAHFSPDGARVAFSARRGRTWHVVVNDDLGPAFRETGAPFFSASGRLGYMARTGQGSTIALDQAVGPMVEEIQWSDLEGSTPPFVFSPDGSMAAWVGAMDGAWHPIVGNAVGPGYGAVKDPTFLDENTVLFWAARDRDIIRVTASLL